MCAKDEEREPLQPDGNNKDVKVNIIGIKDFIESESERVKISDQVINELIEDLTKLDLVGERIPLTRMHNNNKERRHEVNRNTNK